MRKFAFGCLLLGAALATSCRQTPPPDPGLGDTVAADVFEPDTSNHSEETVLPIDSSSIDSSADKILSVEKIRKAKEARARAEAKRKAEEARAAEAQQAEGDGD